MSNPVGFEKSEDIIRVGADIYGPRGIITASLALDTGASRTTLNSDIIRAAGYDSASENKTLLITGSSTSLAPVVKIARVEAINQTVENIEVVCHDRPEESGIDGLRGLNFLCHFDIEINYSNAMIVLKPLHKP
jgi:predicted aspartyl protease